MYDFSLKAHKPLREVVYEELRSLILTGKIPPGTRMMEIELAKQMDVSRTPIREAIRKLEEEGLIDIEPRRGAYVSEISLSDIVNILEVRESLDGLAAYLAAQRMSPENKRSLGKAAKAFNEAVRNNDVEDMIKNDTAFHTIIVESCENNYLTHMIERVQELVLRFRFIYYKDFKRAEDMPEEHSLVYDAIMAGDAEKARHAATIHITRLKEMIENDNLFKS